MRQEDRRPKTRRPLDLRLIGAAAALVALLAGGILLYRSPAFAVRRYRLVGARQLRLASVLQRAQIPSDATLLRFPGEEVRSRVASDPWVESVTVHRRLPDTIEIAVVERVPVAMLDAQRARWLVDGHGWVIARVSADASSALPVVRKVEGVQPKAGTRIASPVLTNALAVLAGVSKEIRRTVRFVDAPSLDQTGLVTAENVDILFGSAEDVVKKDAIARKILAEQRGKVVFIDVRSTDGGVWRGIRD